VKLEFKQILENVRNFYEIREQCEMLVKINGDQLTEEEKNVFLEYFGDYTDKIYIEHTMSCWPEFNLRGVDINPKVGIYGQQIKEVEVCPYPFYSIAINSDGVVSVCFLDWGRKLGLGNIREESLKDVWEGRAMKQYRKMFLEGERKNHPVCGTCGQMTHGNPDNIDPFKKEILGKLNNIGYFENN
jgi:radical SAM protein with 4Fe4S-binding SPASM domain